MGKNRTIKNLANVIGNIVIHKILVKYTNRIESKNHLQSEVDTYREYAIEMAKDYNWNVEDRIRIKEKALKNFKKDMEKYYKDVDYPIELPEIMILETLNELIT